MIDSSRVVRNSLENRVALIVGGNASGGSELALELATLGSDVAILYFGQLPDDALSLKQLVEEQGRRCLLITQEELQDAQLRDALELVRQRLDRVDLFIDFSTESQPEGEFTDDRRLNATDLFPHYDLLAQVMSELTSSTRTDFDKFE